MKVAIITDMHFGSRNDKRSFLDYFEKFYEEIFFPELEKRNINCLLILGDTFDRRKYINFYSLQRTKKMFFDKLKQYNIRTTYMLVGNHDTTFKNTNEINSPELLLDGYENVFVIDKPQTVLADTILMVPWINTSNYQDCLEAIKNTNATICMGHFEIAGFSMYRGHQCEDGLSRDLFDKFQITLSGHYHHKSTSGNIHYLGTPYPMTWQDWNDDRGFHVFDTQTYELEFIKNPYEMFVKVTYDDIEKDYMKEDVSDFKHKYIKIVVVNKTNPYMFDRYLEKIYENEPEDVSIFEDFTELSNEGIDEEMLDQSDDTLTILNKFVDGNTNDTNIDTKKLKNILRELYVESLNMDK